MTVNFDLEKFEALVVGSFVNVTDVATVEELEKWLESANDNTGTALSETSE